ncbi:DNA gyrase C-terminal beta-propeller domain-containing protein [Methylocystis hirsuta]|uniref:DNA gyrase C-terminal beta-propeller domain-containing protein n=1 Tax=Methylocystis hirsuta TaxID=369798 RepID=UPI001FDFEAC5|nr:DNA gyrase C-terminal beta-propeller domain-containing protein [Methylocystis hirsuta]
MIGFAAEIEEGADVVAVLPHVAGAALLLVTKDGRGFVVSGYDLLSSTRKGRAVLTVDPPSRLQIVTQAEGDHVAIIGENRKLLVFPLSEASRMARGKGVRMQRYKDGGVSDAKVFALKDGLTWTDASNRVFTIERRNSRTGSAIAPKREDCRREGFRGIIGLGEARIHSIAVQSDRISIGVALGSTIHFLQGGHAKKASHICGVRRASSSSFQRHSPRRPD